MIIPRAKIKCDLNVTHTAKKMYIFKVNIFFAKFRPWCRSIAKIMQNRPCEGHKCCFLWDLDAGLTFFVWPWCRSDKKWQSTLVRYKYFANVMTLPMYKYFAKFRPCRGHISNNLQMTFMRSENANILHMHDLHQVKKCTFFANDLHEVWKCKYFTC